MKFITRWLLTALVVAMIGIGNLPAQTSAQESRSQWWSGPTTTWTKARWEAAKKRWAQNKQKYHNCNLRLREVSRREKLSLDGRKHFLERCMNE